MIDNDDLEALGKSLIFAFFGIVGSMAIIFVIYFAGLLFGVIIADRSGGLLVIFIACIWAIAFAMPKDKK